MIFLSQNIFTSLLCGGLADQTLLLSSTTAQLVVNSEWELKPPKNKCVEEGQKWNDLVIFPEGGGWVRRDKMSTSRVGGQHWKITGKLEMLLMLVRRFGENTACSSSA